MHHTREKAAPLSPSQLLARLPADVLCLDYLCACKMQVNIAKWSNFYLCQADRHRCALCWEIMELCFPSSLPQQPLQTQHRGVIHRDELFKVFFSEVFYSH